MARVRKAVIPVAGLGTRMLPATKTIPKEMLTVVDRPVIQYAVDEAHAAGIEHIVFVTGRNKASIEDYFDRVPELDETLRNGGKAAQLEALGRMTPKAGSTTFTRQQAPLGLGHAVWCARDVIGSEPFALLLPDMVSFGPRGCLSDAMDLYNAVGGNVITVEQCDYSMTHKYGIVGKGRAVGKGGFAIDGMVEKPAPGTAPSNYYVNGRYILQPEIFGLLATQASGVGGEIQLTDSMVRLAEQQPFYAAPFAGKMYDCGSKEGFVEANIAFAMARDDTRGATIQAMRAQLETYSIQVEAA
jgi:UTP--glucose-1-phosphate uridylyltransferase